MDLYYIFTIEGVAIIILSTMCAKTLVYCSSQCRMAPTRTSRYSDTSFGRDDEWMMSTHHATQHHSHEDKTFRSLSISMLNLSVAMLAVLPIMELHCHQLAVGRRHRHCPAC